MKEINRIKKYSQFRNQLLREESIRKSIIKSDKDLSHYYNSAKKIIDDFDISLLKEIQIPFDNKNSKIQYDEGCVDLSKLSYALKNVKEMHDKSIKIVEKYTDIFNEEFFKLPFFEYAINFKNEEFNGKIRKLHFETSANSFTGVDIDENRKGIKKWWK